MSFNRLTAKSVANIVKVIL